MKCPRCQQENPTGSSFCLECGSRLSLTCGSCGTDLPAGSKFCNKCGTAVSSPSTGQPRFASPESYTPKHLAEKILTSKSALEGERKQVTVLFADLKGSMELLADRDPEEARKILDPVLERMMEAVHRYEGTVNQVMGDGIMALFGAPLAHEDHAVRACYAALRMQESVKKYADELRRSHGAAVKIRVGVNSGEVVVRAIGSDLRVDYTAVGQTTHLAARMEQLADPGAIVITSETLALVEGYVEVKSLGPVPVKGLAGPVEVYEVTGAGLARTRLQAAARRGLTPFVGRDTELDRLRRALEQSGAGHGQVVAVVGEPGVGKSRLYWELTHSHRTEGWLVLESGSVSYGKASTYLPIVDLLKTYFNVDARDSHRAIQEKVSGKLITLDQSLLPSLPPFLALLDLPVEDPQWRALEPAERRQRTLQACRRLLLRESRVQPLLLVFEDLHWIDSETQALLDGMVESLPGARILLLVNYRPEYLHAWGSKTYYTQLRLDPLVQESAEELLRGLLGNAQELEQLKRRLVERTEGNPFFLEESVRTLVETGALMREHGAYRLTAGLDIIQIPGTVQAVLAARIDRLGPDEKRLLQSAAVIGKDVPLWLLQGIVDENEDTLRNSLVRLQTAEFLYETSLFPEVEYTFKHALTHEVAYGSLLQDRRRSLHGRIVEGIEQRYPDRLVEHINSLAHHAFRGEAWHKAVPYLREAGARAGQRSAFRDAVTLFEQALAALAHLPESPDTVAQAIDLRIELRHAIGPSANYAKAHDYLCDAEALAKILGDRRRLGWVLANLSHARRAVGPDQHSVIETAQRALEIAQELSDGALEGTATQYLGQGYFGIGDFVRAVDLLQRAIAAFDNQPDPDRTIQETRRSYGRTWLANALAALGRFAEGIVVGEEAIRTAEAANRPTALVLALSALGGLLIAKGDAERAIPLLERAVAVSRAFEISFGNTPALVELARGYALADRVDEAIPLAEQTVSALDPPVAMLVAAEVYIAARRVGEASAMLERALVLVRKRAERAHQARALALLGRIAAERDLPEVEEADVLYRDALALADPLGMRPLVAHCHLGLGQLYRRTGQREQAQEHLTTAMTMYREMGMTYWLGQAEAEAAAGLA